MPLDRAEYGVIIILDITVDHSDSNKSIGIPPKISAALSILAWSTIFAFVSAGGHTDVFKYNLLYLMHLSSSEYFLMYHHLFSER